MHVAIRLAEAFEHVDLFVPWVGNGMPSEKQRQIGTGIDEVRRVMELWSAAREADLVVFTDVYHYDEAEELRRQGKPVWGAGYAGAFETERLMLKHWMAQHGLPVVPYEVCEGGEELKQYLADKEDLWVKASVTRGDWETTHWENGHLSLPVVEKGLSDMGPRATTKKFIVEQSVPGCEFGWDGYSVDGRPGPVAAYGPEAKDRGYVGRVCHFGDLPGALRVPTETLVAGVGELGCRSFLSTEVRITPDGVGYLIDPCLRAGSPPSEAYMELFSNWAEVIWRGAQGEMVELEPRYQYAAQIVLKSGWVVDNYLPVSIPDELRRLVTLRAYCQLDGKPTVVPLGFEQFGSALGFGYTLEEAKAQAREVAKSVKAAELDWDENVFNELDDVLAEGDKVGIPF
jgi:hypothetical protein